MLPIIYIALSQFAFAALLVFTKPKRQAADFILGYWLILMELFLGLTLIDQYGWSEIKLELFPFAYTLGPFLYVYIQKLTTIKAKIAEKDLLHLIPFALICVIVSTKNKGIDDAFLNGNIFTKETIFFSLSIIIHVFIYAILSIRSLQIHRKHVLDVLSYNAYNISLDWLMMTLRIFTFTFLLTFIFLILNYFFDSRYLNPGYPFFIGLCAFAYMISFFGARQSAVFSIKPNSTDLENDLLVGEEKQEIMVENDNEENQEVENKAERYANSGLAKEIAAKYQNQLIQYFESEKPYILRELNAQMVAKTLGIKQHHLTEVMNEYIGKNFYTFVNEYRVAEVQQLLQNKQFSHYSLLAIAYEAGFNSKSSFNTIFKKITGLTPTEYKLALDKNQSSD